MQESSYMIVYPMDPTILKDPKKVLEPLVDNEKIKVKDIGYDEERGMILEFAIDGAEYKAYIDPVEMEIPSFVRPAQVFTEEESEKLNNAKAGLSVTIDYEGDNNRCFHDQLRLIDVLFPDILAVLDCPSEKLLSGKWISLAAKSSTHPAPRYLFTVQAISDNGDEVWLHTHGLKRCGLYELEVLCSNKKAFNDHYKMIESFAVRMLEHAEDDPIEPGDAVFIGMAEDRELVLTAVDWREALEYFGLVKEERVCEEEDIFARLKLLMPDLTPLIDSLAVDEEVVRFVSKAENRKDWKRLFLSLVDWKWSNRVGELQVK